MRGRIDVLFGLACFFYGWFAYLLLELRLLVAVDLTEWIVLSYLQIFGLPLRLGLDERSVGKIMIMICLDLGAVIGQPRDHLIDILRHVLQQSRGELGFSLDLHHQGVFKCFLGLGDDFAEFHYITYNHSPIHLLLSTLRPYDHNYYG